MYASSAGMWVDLWHRLRPVAVIMASATVLAVWSPGRCRSIT
jgi:hypothetical protein